MDISWKGAMLPDNLLRDKIGEALLILSGEYDDFTVEEFACIHLNADGEANYSGKMLLIRGANEKPLALARYIYGRHISSMASAAAANSFAVRIAWLKEVANQIDIDGENFRPVYFSAPHIGEYGLAISERIYRKLAYVIQAGNELPPLLTLQRWDEFSRAMEERLSARMEALTISLQQRPLGFEGLPG
jgi:hypothetical protein